MLSGFRPGGDCVFIVRGHATRRRYFLVQPLPEVQGRSEARKGWRDIRLNFFPQSETLPRTTQQGRSDDLTLFPFYFK